MDFVKKRVLNNRVRFVTFASEMDQTFSVPGLCPRTAVHGLFATHV